MVVAICSVALELIGSFTVLPAGVSVVMVSVSAKVVVAVVPRVSLEVIPAASVVVGSEVATVVDAVGSTSAEVEETVILSFCVSVSRMEAEVVSITAAVDSWIESELVKVAVESESPPIV